MVSASPTQTQQQQVFMVLYKSGSTHWYSSNGDVDNDNSTGTKNVADGVEIINPRGISPIRR